MRWPPCISFWKNTVHFCLCLVSLTSKRVSWMMKDKRLRKLIGSVGWRNKFPRTIVVTNEKKVRQMNGGVYLCRVDSDSRTQSENLNAIDCYSICFAVIAVIVWEFPRKSFPWGSISDMLWRWGTGVHVPVLTFWSEKCRGLNSIFNQTICPGGGFSLKITGKRV